MGAKTVNKLPVPGATLHYEVSGSGPVLLPFTGYQPDLDALKTVADKIVPAAGLVSAEYLPGRPIQTIAEHLGWPVVTFAGGHTGYASHPAPFATLLARLLEADLPWSTGRARV